LAPCFNRKNKSVPFFPACLTGRVTENRGYPSMCCNL
jgi:hypothetical protein